MHDSSVTIDRDPSEPPAHADDVRIVDDPEQRRYRLLVDGVRKGFVAYHLDEDAGRITFRHTEVASALSGRGLGGLLAAHVLDDARARGLRVVARCPFIANYVRRHTGYQDLVDAA
jgi:predicted GNAT family acetyltransferase